MHLLCRVHKDYSNIKVGDILRVDNDTHSVIVLEVLEDSVIVAEGNYNSAIHWGREIPKAELIDPHSYIMTRYHSAVFITGSSFGEVILRSKVVIVLSPTLSFLETYTPGCNLM